MKNNSIRIGLNLFKLFLGNNELDYLAMVGQDNNPYRIALQLNTSVNYDE